jgi:glucose/arabinose dehydrogenase/polyisoprenoid-binding protein YceI
MRLPTKLVTIGLLTGAAVPYVVALAQNATTAAPRVASLADTGLLPPEPSPSAAAAARWTVDHATSRLSFRSSAGGQSFSGTFDRWDARIAFDPDDLAHASVVVAVDVASANTGDTGRDEALPDPEWFDTARFPRATFTSSDFKALGSGRFEAIGELEIRGVRRPLTLPFSLSISGNEARMETSLVLNRSLFSVGRAQWATADVVPFEVSIQVSVTARRGDLQKFGAASATTPTSSPQPARQCSYGPYWADTFRPAPAFPGQTRAPAPQTPSRIKVETVATGLERAWSLAFLPDGRMLVTERPGRLRIVDKDGTLGAPIEGLPPIKAIANTGLYDVALDPDFARNRTLYFGYFAPAPGETAAVETSRVRWTEWTHLPHEEREKHRIGMHQIARARLSRDERRLEDVRPLVEGAGLDGRIVVARDGRLLITAGTVAAGDRDVDDLPQRRDVTYGKVLRVSRDGAVPPDNPFLGVPGVRPELYAYGIRDPQGAAINPATGDLWIVEHGPRGGDEVNIVRAGRNYGFPTISYGREYSGQRINGGKTAEPGLEQPVYFWTPSIAPSGLLFYTGSLFPEWRGNLFVGAMAGKRLARLVLDGATVVAEEHLLVDTCDEIRDVRQGPDGALYLLTKGPASKLLRLTPQRPPARTAP